MTRARRSARSRGSVVVPGTGVPTALPATGEGVRLGEAGLADEGKAAFAGSAGLTDTSAGVFEGSGAGVDGSADTGAGGSGAAGFANASAGVL